MNPAYPEAHNNLGNALRERGELDEAVAAYRRALAIKPDYAEAHNNLAVALTDRGELTAATASYQRAIELKPNFAKAYNNFSDALRDMGKFDDAVAACRRALQLEPNYSHAKFNLSLLLLLRGDFEQGWPLYEARWNAFRSGDDRDYSQPTWVGSRLEGRRVLIHAEQGLGDSIQFVRYAQLIAERGGEVILECQSSLVELFRGVRGVSEVVTVGDVIPSFNLHVPMLSLPWIFKTARETIPRDVPYLFADPARREIWRERLAGDLSRLKVGLAWAGNRQNIRLRKRHIPFESLRPLLDVEGIDFFSLQMEGGAEQIGQGTGALRIVDYSERIKDCADTAAFMAELDLIISVDTATAHLAGALGRPVWLLLPFVPDWRWGLESETTPWYPTMRLFRQPAAGDWQSVIQRAMEELRGL